MENYTLLVYNPPMFPEAETKITRPKWFPECTDCPVANKIVNYWLSFKPTLPYISKATESVTIECQVKNGYVLLLEKSLVKIQFRKGRQVVPIEGGNLNPEIVPCPHFINLKTDSAPISEPE